MKKLTVSFWLTLAAAGMLIVQAASTNAHPMRADDPAPTCPPLCPPPGEQK